MVGKWNHKNKKKIIGKVADFTNLITKLLEFVYVLIPIPFQLEISKNHKIRDGQMLLSQISVCVVPPAPPHAKILPLQLMP